MIPDSSSPDGLPAEVSAGLARRSAAGVGWLTASGIASQLLQLVGGVWLAHLLAPRAFGLVAMVAVFSGFAVILTDLGLGAALVQMPNMSRPHIESAMFINVCSGILLTLIFAALARPISDFYRTPDLYRIVLVMSLIFTINVAAVPMALLQRALRFRAMACCEIAGILTSTAAAVIAALTGAGAWALVTGSLAFVFIESATALVLSRCSLRARLHRDSARDVWRFSAPLATFSAVNYWSRSADNLLIGRFVGAVGLAFYTRAYQLMTVTSLQPSVILGRVLFPALSSMGNDLARIARVWRRALGIMAAVAFPLSLGLAACAPTALDALLGQRWTAAGDAVRYLALVGCMQCLVTTIGWIFQSRGATRMMARVGFVSNAVCIASFFAGVHWGIAGVAAAYAGANAATFYYELNAASTLLDVSVGSLLRPLATTFVAAAAMGCIVFAVDHFARTSVTPVPTLLLDVAAGAIVYALLLAILRPAAVADIRHTLGTLRARSDAEGPA